LYKAQFQITRGSTENVLKKTWGLSLNFFAKSDARCFTPVMEIMPKLTELIVVVTATQTYSLSEECFGYNCGRLKSSASHASRENTLLRCGKIPKCGRNLQRRFFDGRTDGRSLL